MTHGIMPSRLVNVFKKALEYSDQIHDVAANTYRQQLNQLAQTGQFKYQQTPSDQAFNTLAQPVVQQVLTNVFGDPNSPQAQQRAQDVTDEFRDHVATGRHDWEPDANVFPYHPDITRLEFSPKLREFMLDEGNQESMIHWLETSLKGRMKWEQRRNEQAGAKA